MSEHRTFILTWNETPHHLPDLEKALEFLNQVAQADGADLWAEIDHGSIQLSWLDRFLGLRGDRDIEQAFHLEKEGRVATLIFFDDAESEYRATDPAQPIEATLEERQAVSQGEALPAPLVECLHSDRAFAAAAEYLQRGKRPDWLTYLYVK